jgi:hypothetical protein
MTSECVHYKSHSPTVAGPSYDAVIPYLACVYKHDISCGMCTFLLTQVRDHAVHMSHCMRHVAHSVANSRRSRMQCSDAPSSKAWRRNHKLGEIPAFDRSARSLKFNCVPNRRAAEHTARDSAGGSELDCGERCHGSHNGTVRVYYLTT